jgi:hypothetical protein
MPEFWSTLFAKNPTRPGSMENSVSFALTVTMTFLCWDLVALTDSFGLFFFLPLPGKTR